MVAVVAVIFVKSDPSPWNVSPTIFPNEAVEFDEPVMRVLWSPSLSVPYPDPVNCISPIVSFATLIVFALIEKNAPSFPFTVAYCDAFREA